MSESIESMPMHVIEKFLVQLHRMEYENNGTVDSIDELQWQLSDRAFFHLLGFIEQFSEHYDWEPGTIVEYLGRMPPCERWEELSEEMRGWKKRSR